MISTPPWARERKDAAVERGPHPSADEHSEFLREEMLEMCKRGQWMVLPYSAVRDRPHLRVSPPGVIPQRERRPRTIVDYTFSGVNGETIKMAPAEAMQFGRALPRLLQLIYDADPAHGPVYMTKVDVSDGFYQIWLNCDDVDKLGIVMPGLTDDDEPLIAFPLSLPMGWVESPPAFCVATETAADLANADIARNADKGRHRHDEATDTPTPTVPPVSKPGPKPR